MASRDPGGCARLGLVESVQRSMRSRTFDRGFVLADRDRSQASEHGVKAFNDLYLRHMSGPDA
ncbi:MAG: hypothetical protein OXI15_00250 [Chromatiales bacterium]|nr:hypothetical protein [Chromatiales bacterium]